MQQTRDLESNWMVELGEDETIHLPERNLIPEDSTFMPRQNRGSFLEHALIVPERLAADFHAGEIDGWYVELHFTKQDAESLPLLIAGDIVIGRGDADIN